MRSSHFKSSSRLYPDSLTFSYACSSYRSVIVKRKTLEQAKLLAVRGEERSKHNLELLENSFELEKERLSFKAAEPVIKQH